MSEFIVEHLPDTTSIEREEIVRCRDCKYGIEVIWPVYYDIPADWLNCHGYLAPSWDYYNDCPSETPVSPDGFCAWACRKSEDDMSWEHAHKGRDMTGQWWEFCDPKNGMLDMEFIVRCKECGEPFAVRSLSSLPDECPGCKSKMERREK